ncbi:L-rhamnose mutarotase [Microbacterium sp. EST19A]|uniref:L-rhamnose mutarotase n=1 Tax=Microbacterium sp. EST19A TaxID=2862681 RepID=UPI001CC06B7F|nr:L-rhamnose mutarotase [Microbacterium sp. EST19A]
MGTVIEGYRTRLRPGAAAAYVRVHAQIPSPLHTALTDSGMVSWRIWIDGDTLFHVIETRDGRELMIDRMIARGPVDPQWDAVIEGLVDDAPESTSPLALVWDSTTD